jgi:hypothetical protein
MRNRLKELIGVARHGLLPQREPDKGRLCGETRAKYWYSGRKSDRFAWMETMPPDSQAELVALRMLVAEQAAKISEQEAEVSKRDSIIDLLRSWHSSVINSMARLRRR